MLCMVIELRQALHSYQGYHMVCFSTIRFRAAGAGGDELRLGGGWLRQGPPGPFRLLPCAARTLKYVSRIRCLTSGLES